jgi:hypothetical protein
MVTTSIFGRTEEHKVVTHEHEMHETFASVLSQVTDACVLGPTSLSLRRASCTRLCRNSLHSLRAQPGLLLHSITHHAGPSHEALTFTVAPLRRNVILHCSASSASLIFLCSTSLCLVPFTIHTPPISHRNCTPDTLPQSQVLNTNSSSTGMASPNETAAATTGANSKTGFLDIPRELRDEIYDLALEHDRATSDDHGIMSLHVRAPEPRLRLVSKQFVSEYYGRSPSNTNICLLVVGCTPTTRFQSAGGFPYAARASAVDITLVQGVFGSYDDSVYDYFEHLTAWLMELVKDMPCMKKLHLRLGFTIPPKLTVIDYYSRMAHRNVQNYGGSFLSMLVECKKKQSALPLFKVDVELIMSKLDSGDANVTGVEVGKVASWTHEGGYRQDAGFAGLRGRYSSL